MSRSSITLNDAIARMVNLYHPNQKLNILEIAKSIKQGAKINKDNCLYPQMEYRAEASKALASLTEFLTQHLSLVSGIDSSAFDHDISGLENSILKVEDVIEWAAYYYRITRFDYEELNYNQLFVSPTKSVKNTITKGLTPRLAVHLCQTFNYLLEELAKKKAPGDLVELLCQRASQTCDNQNKEAIEGRINLAKAISTGSHSPKAPCKRETVSVTIDEAVARMINLEDIPYDKTLLEMTDDLATTEEDNDEKGVCFKAHEARHHLAYCLRRHIISELEEPPEKSLLKIATDSASIVRLDMDSVIAWAHHHYSMTRLDYEELNYNAFLDDPLKSNDKKVKAVLKYGLPPPIAVRLYLTVAYSVEAYAEQAGNKYGSADKPTVDKIAELLEGSSKRSGHKFEAIKKRIELAMAIRRHIMRQK